MVWIHSTFWKDDANVEYRERLEFFIATVHKFLFGKTWHPSIWSSLRYTRSSWLDQVKTWLDDMIKIQSCLKRLIKSNTWSSLTIHTAQFASTNHLIKRTCQVYLTVCSGLNVDSFAVLHKQYNWVTIVVMPLFFCTLSSWAHVKVCNMTYILRVKNNIFGSISN